MTWVAGDTARLLAALTTVAAVTGIYAGWLQVSNAATISTTFLLVVLVVAATSRLAVAIATSIAAMLAFNYFFLPPVGTWTIADPQNWVALAAFLAVSVVASHLSAVARARAQEALGRRDELARLFDVSRDVLLITESREAMAAVARAVARRFDLEFVAIALPRAQAWDLFEAGSLPAALDPAALGDAFAAAQASLEFDAYARTYAGHRVVTVEGQAIRLVPLRAGTRPIGLLAAGGRPIEAGTLDALAGVVAIAIERAQFLEERRDAALTRQSEELKSALLNSLAHDLRTPLTAIRVAASNMQAPWLAPDDRAEQSDLILTEVERLTRLFDNILEMARIDAGSVGSEARWTYPSEIVAAAREQVEQTLRGHPLEVTLERDVPVRLDPRLTAAALARLLENAAQYAAAESPIAVTADIAGDELMLTVRDRGAGIPDADLPHLFERFYRGAAAGGRSGTGLGLAIARGLLAAQRGRIWAENDPGGGARFRIAVPAPAQNAVPAASPSR